jgi:hypothetical protein
VIRGVKIGCKEQGNCHSGSSRGMALRKSEAIPAQQAEVVLDYAY